MFVLSKLVGRNEGCKVRMTGSSVTLGAKDLTGNSVGLEVGWAVGCRDGRGVGKLVGSFVGARVGFFVGAAVVGEKVGLRLGDVLGVADGIRVGRCVGFEVGFRVGTGVGFPGRMLGCDEGMLVGREGAPVGSELEGIVVLGNDDGAVVVGLNEGFFEGDAVVG